MQRVEAVLEMPDPSTQIPQLDGLLSPVEAHLSGLREAELADAQKMWQNRYDELLQLAQGSLDSAALKQLLAPMLQLKGSLDAAKTIDAVRARRSEIDARAGAVSRQVVDMINTLHEETPPSSGVGVAAPRVRPVVTVKVRTLTSKSLLETEADLQVFLQQLETRLREELKRENRVQLDYGS